MSPKNMATSVHASGNRTAWRVTLGNHRVPKVTRSA